MNGSIGWTRLAALFAVAGWLASLAPVVSAADDVPEGIKAGPWILAPYVSAAYGAESNVLRTANGEGDNVTELAAGISAILPFRNSSLDLYYDVSQLTYENFSFDRDLDQEFGLAANFNFSSFDTVSLRNTFLAGFSDLGRVDEGGELALRGEPYQLNRVDLEFSRRVADRPGYFSRISYYDQKWTGDGQIPFFDYTGFDVQGEYRQPLPGEKWILGYIQIRDFDHFNPNEPGSEPFRRENSRSAQVGLRGFLGEGQPFVLRLGYGEFEYDFSDEAAEFGSLSDFQGITGHFDWNLRLGGRTRLQMAIDRRPQASNFNTFYVHTSYIAEFRRPWLRDTDVGLRFRWVHNDYADPIEVNGCGTFTREDRRGQIAPYAEWYLHPRFAYRMTASYEFRRSNCDVFSYNALDLGVGLVLGWF